MKKTATTLLAAAAAAAALLAVGAGSAAAAGTVPIIMKDPGCHWFLVGGKSLAKLSVSGATSFRNLDEAALIFKGKSFNKRVAIGKTLAIAAPGTYHITMVGQHPDDNNLLLVVK